MFAETLSDPLLRRAFVGRRVLFVLGGFGRGGAEKQALLLAAGLRSRYGAQVKFLGLGPGGYVAERCRESQIAVALRPFRANESRVKRLIDILGVIRAIRACRPDVVAPYTIVPNVVTCASRSLIGWPFCVWNQREEGRERLGRKIEQVALRCASVFVANSRSGVDFLVNCLGVARERTAIVYNGVICPAPLADRAEWRRRLCAGAENCVVTMVANVHAPKDHATALRAMALSCRRRKAGSDIVRLVFAGRIDEDATSLRRLVAELGLEDSVLFLGEVDDVDGLLAASDIAVLSSRGEGLPNAALEAMAAGLPFIGTDLPGVREALGPEGEECVVPPGDATGLAARLDAFVASPELRTYWGTRNRQRAESEFSVDKMVRSMASIFAAGVLRGSSGLARAGKP